MANGESGAEKLPAQNRRRGHLPWRFVLPLAQVCLASMLLVAAQYERAEHVAELRAKGFVSVWDYMPPSQAVAHAINLPALLLCAPISATSPRNALLQRVAYILAVAAFWFWLGRAIDRRLGSIPRTSWQLPRGAALSLRVLALLASLGVGIYSLTLLVAPPLLNLSGLVWSLVLMGYFGRPLVRSLLSRAQKISE